VSKGKVIKICLEEEKNIEKIREVSLILQEQVGTLTKSNGILAKENEVLKKNFKLATSQTQHPPAQK